MSDFKLFLEAKIIDEEGDVQKTLKKLPKSHRDLVAGYRISFIGKNTLSDGQSVGSNHLKNKKMVIASPWNFGREFALLHEIGHLVWEKLPEPTKHQWKQLVQKNSSKQIQQNPQAKDSLKQNPEEIFCHCYANFYSKHKNVTYNNLQWMKFIKNLP